MLLQNRALFQRLEPELSRPQKVVPSLQLELERSPLPAVVPFRPQGEGFLRQILGCYEPG